MKSTHDIACELESIVSKMLDYDFSNSGTFFDANIIESNTFYAVMDFIIFLKEKKDGADFINDIREHCGNKRMNEIEDYEFIFEEFKERINL